MDMNFVLKWNKTKSILKLFGLRTKKTKRNIMIPWSFEYFFTSKFDKNIKLLTV